MGMNSQALICEAARAGFSASKTSSPHAMMRAGCRQIAFSLSALKGRNSDESYHALSGLSVIGLNHVSNNWAYMTG
jgi:hypothetical protein